MSSIKRMRPLLGTFVEVGVDDASINAENAFSAAFGAIEQVQQRLSFHDVNSELSKLNHSHGQAVELSTITICVLRFACAVMQASDHRFNCTVGGALVRANILPDHKEKDFIDYGYAADIEIHGKYVSLKRPVIITLDGIAKGYAVDCAVDAMRKCGSVTGWVNAGGDLKVFGDMALPVQRREINGSYQMLGGLRDLAMATSYASKSPMADFPGQMAGESYALAEGAWTVVARSAWRADALTKVASFSLDAEREILLRKLGGYLVGTA